MNILRTIVKLEKYAEIVLVQVIVIGNIPILSKNIPIVKDNIIQTIIDVLFFFIITKIYSLLYQSITELFLVLIISNYVK